MRWNHNIQEGLFTGSENTFRTHPLRQNVGLRSEAPSSRGLPAMLKADRREETIQVITDEDKIERRSVTDKDFQLQMYILRVATVR